MNATRMLTVGGVSVPGLLTQASCVDRAGINAETGTELGGGTLCGPVLETIVAGV